MVIWVTGLSGAGKTTICQCLYARLKPTVPELVLLDGDALRESVSTDLGFSEADRVRQISRVQRLARLLSAQDLVVLVAVVYASPQLLAWNRTNIADYVEVLVDVPIEVVKARDPKGLYSRAARGEAPDVVGIDLSWHRPVNADLTINLATCPTPEEGARAIAAAVPRLAAQWRAEETGV